MQGGKDGNCSINVHALGMFSWCIFCKIDNPISVMPSLSAVSDRNIMFAGTISSERGYSKVFQFHLCMVMTAPQK